MNKKPRKHFTQKDLMEMANDLAGAVHEHYGSKGTNKRIIYGILRLVQQETKAACQAPPSSRAEVI